MHGVAKGLGAWRIFSPITFSSRTYASQDKTWDRLAEHNQQTLEALIRRETEIPRGIKQLRDFIGNE